MHQNRGVVCLLVESLAFFAWRGRGGRRLFQASHILKILLVLLRLCQTTRTEHQNQGGVCLQVESLAFFAWGGHGGWRLIAFSSEKSRRVCAY